MLLLGNLQRSDPRLRYSPITSKHSPPINSLSLIAGKAYLVAMGVESSTSMALFEKTSDIFENLAGKRGNPYFAPAFHKQGEFCSVLE